MERQRTAGKEAKTIQIALACQKPGLWVVKPIEVPRNEASSVCVAVRVLDSECSYACGMKPDFVAVLCNCGSLLDKPVHFIAGRDQADLVVGQNASSFGVLTLVGQNLKPAASVSIAPAQLSVCSFSVGHGNLRGCQKFASSFVSELCMSSAKT